MDSLKINFDWSQGIDLLHCEGYCLYRPQLAKEMMIAAKVAGALVSMDLASFEVSMPDLSNPICDNERNHFDSPNPLYVYQDKRSGVTM